jgi:LacI family transcriptional regulator
MAREMGYVPSRAGRMLVSGRTDFIGMLLSVYEGQLSSPFLGSFVSGLAEAFAAAGRDLFISTVAATQSEREVIDHIINGKRADALVINRTWVNDERVSYLIDRGFPFVSHGRVLGESRPFSWFDTDGEAAFAAAAERLIALGHTRFGLLTIEESFTFATLRRAGLERALAAAGLRLDPADVAAVPIANRRAGEEAAARLLARADRPTAILGITDSFALYILEAAKRAGIVVPDELSVIGFDNVPVAAYSDPPLSTFDQRVSDSAAAVAAMVVALLEKGSAAIGTTLIEAPFIARASHGPAPVRRRPSAAATPGGAPAVRPSE